MRDGPGFLSTRRTILEGKPTLRASWIAFAVANFLTADYETAIDVINKYQDGVADKAEAYEESELILFQNQCFEMQGKYEAAINHLIAKESLIVDKWSYKIKYAQLMTLSGKFTESVTLWEKLLLEQPENYQFHSGLHIALLELSPELASDIFRTYTNELPGSVLELTDSQRERLVQWYLANPMRKSRAFTKIQLFINRENTPEFQAKLSEFMIHNLVEGVPSVTNDIAALVLVKDEQKDGYLRPAKEASEYANHYIITMAQSILSTYLSDYLASLQTNSSSSGSNNSVTEKTTRKSPIAILWGLQLQSHLFELSGHFTSAITSIDAAIFHTPTALDMLAKKAHLYKKVGDVASAAKLMDTTRALDLQDRYLNNQATKYFLQADEIDSAMNTIAMFTKHEGDPQKTLFDLQCIWYELELAEAYARKKEWSLALKKFDAIRKHFLEQYDDLFDFHGYCIRKTTLRAYMDVMKVQDNSFGHPFFQRALIGTLKIYLHLLDSPEDIDGLGHLTAQERKKERARRVKEKKARELQQQKDAVAKQQQIAEEAEANKAKDEKDEEKDSSNNNDKDKDEDPLGESYITNKDFLLEATNNWVNLITHRNEVCAPELLALIADIMIRRNKFIQALRLLNIGLKNTSSHKHPELVVMVMKCVVKFKVYLTKKLPTANATVNMIVKQELSQLIGGENQLANVAYLETISADLTSAAVWDVEGIFGLIRAQAWIVKGTPAALSLLGNTDKLWNTATEAKGVACWPLIVEIVKVKHHPLYNICQ